MHTSKLRRYGRPLLLSILAFLPLSGANAQMSSTPSLPPRFMQMSGNMMVGSMNRMGQVPIVGDTMAGFMHTSMQRINKIPILGPIHMEMMDAATLLPKKP
jgi:hypothetical protein